MPAGGVPERQEDAVRVLKRCRELSRKSVLVSDLRRGLLAKVGVYLLTALIFLNPMTKYDASAAGFQVAPS